MSIKGISSRQTSPSITKPTFEHHHNGIGLGCSNPRVSWRFNTEVDTVPNWKQTNYEIEVSGPSAGPETFSFASEENVLVPWPARSLQSRESATVRVRVHGSSGHSAWKGWSEWSAPSTVEAALLEKDDFKASFIAATSQIGPEFPVQPRVFSKKFEIAGDVPKDARLYITALGVFKAYINGNLVSDEEMAPGWTSYRNRLNYRVWTVDSLMQGENEIRVEAAEGWYAGRLGFKGGKRFFYGDEVGLFAQLHAGKQVICTGESWECRASDLQSSEIYDGEVLSLDAREEDTVNTKALPWPSAKLVAPDAPPVRVTEELPALEITKSPSGKTIIDFGQNLVGKLLVRNLKVDGKVTFKHAEVLEHGELGTRPLREAKAMDTITGRGTLPSWTPRYTFHGFRYVQVEGWEPKKEDLTALVIHTDLKRRGHFDCSNASVNKLHKNVVWSMRGNFLSIPTDCPQRDERLGWTGDIQVFCPSASFLMDTTAMLGEWLQDVAVEQKDGIPPLVVPDILPDNWPHVGQAVWDDVLVLTPDVLHTYSADKSMLRRQFESMRLWLEQGVDRGEDGLWNPEQWQLGDWLDPAAPPEDPGNARCDGTFVANAYLIQVTRVFARVAALLGEEKLSSTYAEQGEHLLQRFQYKYITPEGQIMANSQTGIALAIHFDLISQAKLPIAAKSLDKLVRTARFRVATGFAGTPIITHALTKAGLPQLAYRMLLEKGCPSWMYPVTMGATTIWERWDSMLPNGSINPGQMTSFNHYALGSIADWLHGTVGGISPLEPGWKKVRVQPVPGGNLTSACSRFDGPYGEVSCSWRLQGERMSLTVIIPPSSTAEVVLPSSAEESVRTVGSGLHEFQCDFKAAEWPPKPIVAINQRQPEPDIAE